MRTESVMNYARVAAASIILAALGTAATAQESAVLHGADRRPHGLSARRDGDQ